MISAKIQKWPPPIVKSGKSCRFFLLNFYYFGDMCIAELLGDPHVLLCFLRFKVVQNGNRPIFSTNSSANDPRKLLNRIVCQC